MDIVRDCVTGNPFKLMGQIVGTHKIFTGKVFQRQIFCIVQVDEVGNRIDTFRHGVFGMFTFIQIVILEAAQGIQKFCENTVQDELMGSCKLLCSRVL